MILLVSVPFFVFRFSFFVFRFPFFAFRFSLFVFCFSLFLTTDAHGHCGSRRPVSHHGRCGRCVFASIRDLPPASVTLTMAHWLGGGGPKRRRSHGHRGRRWLFLLRVISYRAGRPLFQFFQLALLLTVDRHHAQNINSYQRPLKLAFFAVWSIGKY